MIKFTNQHLAGYIPYFLSENDPRPAREQIDEAYVGGWHSFKGHTLKYDDGGNAFLEYPEDPPTLEVARAQLRDETLILFQHSWLAIVQPDGSYEIARID